MLFIGFGYFSPNFGVLLIFWEIAKIKIEDPRWPTFVAVITSVADLKENLSVRNIYPPSLIVIASIVAKLWRGWGGSASLWSKNEKEKFLDKVKEHTTMANE